MKATFFPKLTVSPAEPRVKSIDLEAPRISPFAITVHFDFIATQEEACKCARAVACDMVNRIAFTFKVSVDDPLQESVSLRLLSDSAATEHQLEISQSVRVSDSAECSNEPSPASIQQLKKALEKPYKKLRGWNMMGIYRSALKMDNPVDRFLCLYSILLLQQQDSQANVDAFILDSDPSVVQTQFQNRRKETVYTRLRNEFAHIREDTSFDKTRQEMEQHLGGLKDLAYQACLIHPIGK